jgi:hypothetical protein
VIRFREGEALGSEKGKELGNGVCCGQDREVEHGLFYYA